MFCIEEEIKIVTSEESGAFIDEEKDFFNGLEHGTTVENLLTALENDLDYIVVKDKDGNDATITTDNHGAIRNDFVNTGIEKVVFYDSLKKLPFRVATIAKAFNLQMAKGEIDYKAVRPKGWELTDEEKEYKSLRKQIQEKLIKFATRVPVFMYLTDYRERSLKDVITQLEPGLFKKVTGLSVKDFELLVSLDVFNSALMNDAIYKFKRYEDSSLSYTGIEKNISDEIGGWDTVIRREEYQKLFFNQQATMDFVAEIVPEVIEEIAPAVVEDKTPPKMGDSITATYGVKPTVSTTITAKEEPKKVVKKTAKKPVKKE